MGKETVGKGLAVIFIGAILAIGLAGVFSDLSAEKTVPSTPDAMIQAEPPAAIPISTSLNPAAASNGTSLSSEKTQGELQHLLQAWGKAWAGKDIVTYLSFYAPDFQGNVATPEQWRTNRKRILGQAEFIDLKIGKVDINLESDDLATLNFPLDYASDRFEDRGIKTLQLRRNNGRWLIEDEAFASE